MTIRSRGARVATTGVGQVGADAGGIWAGAAQKGLEHGGAGVDSVDLDGWVGAEQAGGEAAVAIADNKGAATMRRSARNAQRIRLSPDRRSSIPSSDRLARAD